MAQKGRTTTADYLPQKEYLRLLECLNKDREYLWELYAVLGFATGCRASDVLALKWKEVLGRNYIVKLEQKTQKLREIKIGESVQACIQHLYLSLGSPEQEQYIFYNKATQTPYSIWTINRKIKMFKFKYKLNIRAFSSHSYRKTLGRYVYDSKRNKSESLLLLQKMLNHKNSQTTMCYIGLVQSDIDQIYDSIHINI